MRSAHPRRDLEAVAAFRLGRFLAVAAFVVASAVVFTGCKNSSGDSSTSGCGTTGCKIVAPDAERFDTFGYSTAVDGELVVVGSASGELGTKAGAAYVFRFDGSIWVPEQKLFASDGAGGDELGISVAIEGNVVVVGSSREDTGRGAVYVYRFDGTDWVEEQKLVASDAADDDQFGISVAISGDVIAVGADSDDDNGNSSGAAYVFRYDGMSWVEEEKLTPSISGARDRFGISIAVDGDVIVVGAFQTERIFLPGAAFAYRYDGANWQEEAALTASDATAGDDFGVSVDVEDTLIVVGAHKDSGAEEQEGGAYVYRYDGADWNEEQRLGASDAGAFDNFGISVAIDAGKVVVGSFLDDDDGNRSGSAYVFGYDTATWIQELKLTAPDAGANDSFGRSVNVDEGSVVVGAYQDGPGNEASGSAYVFELDD